MIRVLCAWATSIEMYIHDKPEMFALKGSYVNTGAEMLAEKC
jgi:hypothetical protein